MTATQSPDRRQPVTDVRDDLSPIVPSPDALVVLAECVDRALGYLIRALNVEAQEWSASGGAHLSGLWRATETPVLIKLGVNRNQLYWTQQIAAAAPDLVPLLYASGDHLGELPIGWTVMERVPFGSLGPAWNGHEFEMLLEAAIKFQRVARTIEPHHIATFDVTLLRRQLEVGLAANPPGPAEVVMDRLDQDWSWVASVCTFEICHGDVHMCNVVTRTPPPHRSDALLIDCQPIIQPWAFDAAYPQILNSIDRKRVGYRELVPKTARLRSAYGLQSCEGRDLEALARITLAWFAIRLWGLTPDRHAMRDYRDETERYITDSAGLHRQLW